MWIFFVDERFILQLFKDWWCKVWVYDHLRLQQGMMGKIFGQHYLEQGGWKSKEWSFCLKWKVKLSSFCLIAWNHYWPLKKNCVCICIYFPIHWCVICKGHSPWRALLLWMREGLQSVLQRHFCCTWCESLVSIHLGSCPAERLTLHYTKTWVIRAEQRPCWAAT